MECIPAPDPPPGMVPPHPPTEVAGYGPTVSAPLPPGQAENARSMRGWAVAGYSEVRVLGSGGFGEVVLARHDASGQLVAIKYLHRDRLLKDPRFAELFRAEAAVLASLDDPHVVRLYEYVESPGGAAIVMELVEGVSLREILSGQGKTTAEAALVVLQGSLLGLAAAHRRGVVHRDYKPENVLINGDGASKLTDFGIAARAGDSPVPAGTLAYAPPEQFGGSPATPASDVYAATATFYECLTGRPPFTGATTEMLLRQHLAEPVPLEPVPGPLRPLVTAGLAKDPGARPADGAALVAELRAVAGQAYGPGWEDRGRSALAAAALLLAALWPTGGPTATQGTALHRVRLRRHLLHGKVGAGKAAIMAGVVVVGVAAAVIVARHTGHPHRSSGLVNTSFSVPGGLAAVAATSASNAWAVGSTGSSLNPKPLIAHWNGTRWKQVPSSGVPGVLHAVAATSATNAWAVGGTVAGQSLILHWNGTSWQQVPSAGAAGIVTGVSASSATNAWAVASSSSSAKGVILHWNGTSWQQVPSPSLGGRVSLNAVAVISERDAWAVGDVSTGTFSETSVILHWNGTSWQQVPGPSPSEGKFGNGLADVAATSATSAWAVGCTDGCPTGGTPLIERWDGTSWKQVAAPTTPYSLYNLSGVAAISATSAWAVGGGGPVTAESAATVDWNGRGWTLGGITGAGLAGVTATSASNAWAVGGSASGRTLILHWNGHTWSSPGKQVSPGAAPASSTAPAAVASPTLPARQQAAQALAALLAQSGADRASVRQAVGAVQDCSPGLSQDETVFSNAASSRQALLGQLAALPDRSALPASMLQDLTAAWQASGQADQDFADWTQDEIAQGCSTNDQSDASYQAAMGPDDQATTDKKAFAARWTAIANEYGLPLYRYNQI
jgi:eukaryotic-like serine/threonine-protein kinase